MLSAPQAIAAMIEVSLPAGFTAPDFTRVDGSSTCSPINSESPVCSANSSTGTNPAADTRFRSSNTADPTVNVYDDCTENAFPSSGQNDVTTRIFPAQKAFSLFTRRSDNRPIHGFRLRRWRCHPRGRVGSMPMTEFGCFGGCGCRLARRWRSSLCTTGFASTASVMRTLCGCW